MQGFVTFVSILAFILPCLCTRLNVQITNGIYNVMQYGARGDGKSDDSQVYVSMNFYSFKLISIYIS